MRRLLLMAAGLVLFGSHGVYADGVQLRIQMGFPAVLPPLVVVQPGVRVVQDFDDEVFFTGGYYWVSRDGNWYRTRDHRGTWRYVRLDRVPSRLVHFHPGQYRRWQHDEGRGWPDYYPHARRGSPHWSRRDWRDRHPSQQQPVRNEDGRGGGNGHGKDGKH
jgi:hypothetical protein